MKRILMLALLLTATTAIAASAQTAPAGPPAGTPGVGAGALRTLEETARDEADPEGMKHDDQHQHAAAKHHVGHRQCFGQDGFDHRTGGGMTSIGP